MRNAIGLVSMAAAIAVAGSATAVAASGARDVKSGATQVVATLGEREITLSELRIEMQRLRLNPASPDAERLALSGLVERELLAEAARETGLHRKPDALARMRAAETQALAELFYASASLPLEPTRSEIEDFIAKNASLFRERRIYDFQVLTLPSEAFTDELTPLFDESEDFSAFEKALTQAGVDYALGPARRDGATFPKPIREQLAAYGPTDNVVLRGPDRTEIYKILSSEPSDADPETFGPLARRLLLERAASERGRKLIDRLKAEASLTIHRESARPEEPAQAVAPTAAAATPTER
ncbi:MAG: peptidyl-prolyl cis-trans isomerase [Parvularculaceae bacterium]